jgi:GntR family transcriptional regulator
MEGLEIKLGSGSLYEQVLEDLLTCIRRGDYKPGEMLPTEEELCRHYGVSRITIRRAMTELASQFLVVRKRGVGTVVTKRMADRRAFHFTGFLESRTTLKAQPLTSVAEPADQEVANMLRIKRGTSVRHISVVTRRNGEPFTYTDAFTVELRNHNSGAADYAGEETPGYAYGLRLGRRIERAEQEMDATAVDVVAAQHLGIAASTPVLRARRVYLDASGEPIRYVIVRYHPDRYRFIVDLKPSVGASVFETAMANEEPPRARRESRSGRAKTKRLAAAIPA